MRAFELRRWTVGGVALAVVCSVTVSGAQIAGDAVPKLVHLVIDRDFLTASNIRTSRFDELKLNARERVGRSAVGEAVILVVTNQRIIAYGVGSGWRPIARAANEQVESLTAEDYAGLVVTSRRLLNFNGQSGIWGEHDRPVSR